LNIRTEVKIAMEAGIVGTYFTFNDMPDGREHIAIKLGTVAREKKPLVRIHSECLTGDVFGSARCDCGPQLKEAINMIHEEGGYLLYLRQEGRGIGLLAKLESYVLQDEGLNTYEANEKLNFPKDMRTYDVAAWIRIK